MTKNLHRGDVIKIKKLKGVNNWQTKHRMTNNFVEVVTQNRNGGSLSPTAVMNNNNK